MELNRRAVPGIAMQLPEASIPTQNMDSILNRNAPATSIYRTTLNLLDKLACIPGFEVYLASLLDDNPRDTANGGGQYLDPIQLLWDTFRQGTSLCVIYNALQPAEPLNTTLNDAPNTLNQRKDRVYRFVKACKENHIVKDEDLFTISELFKDDTNSFVKVLKTVEIVVDAIQSRGLLDTSRLVKKPSAKFAEAQLGPPQDNRERVIKEFVETERRYSYMLELQKQNIVSNEKLRYMFANLNSMVDFQRRFLVGVEANASLPPDEQHFGALFINMEEGFAVYEPYCANYARASKLCISEEQALGALSHIIEPHYELPSMLIKPVQRICKYPIMMDELTKFYDASSPVFKELKDGISAINRIVEQVNEAERKENNLAVVGELEDRVEDWKGYSISTFGELFLHDTFIMSTTGVERELLIYLFENILICCKEVTDKEKDKRRTPKHRSNMLQLKGRIFLYSIHSVVDTSRDNQLSLTIYWRDVVMENFSLACRTDDQLKLWKTTMERLIARTKEKIQASDQSHANIATIPAQRMGPNQYNNGSGYESDEDLDNIRRGRYSEGSSLTAAMQQEKAQNALGYRKTYDGAGTRSRNAKKSVGDYQSELIDGVERSMTVSYHRRQPTNGSNSSAGDYIDHLGRARGSPMPSNSYFNKHDLPPIPVPALGRSDSDAGARSTLSPMSPGMQPMGTPVAHAATTPLSAASGPHTPLTAGSQARPTKVKVHFQDDIFVIVVKPDVQFKDLVDRVERKIKICAGPRVGVVGSQEQDLVSTPPLGIRMRYQDEDGDMIIIGSDEDVQLAFESANASRSDQNVMSTLNLFVSL
ncbi:Guanine nucleotide exchange factor for Cdc42p [Dipsacomyces acuminosporus]|nr:Guanine nucleotide exchange factor for Cdc42p [Dipsacomyces acuminosporus]